MTVDSRRRILDSRRWMVDPIVHNKERPHEESGSQHVHYCPNCSMSLVDRVLVACVRAVAWMGPVRP